MCFKHAQHKIALSREFQAACLLDEVIESRERFSSQTPLPQVTVCGKLVKSRIGTKCVRQGPSAARAGNGEDYEPFGERNEKRSQG